MLDLFFDQRRDLCMFDELCGGKALVQTFGHDFDNIIIISQVFKIALPRFQAGGRFAVDNLFDVDYESEANFPGPGRMFWVGLSAKY